MNQGQTLERLEAGMPVLTAGGRVRLTDLDLHCEMLYAQRDRVLHEIGRRPMPAVRPGHGLSGGRV